ncbi:hypothetical protein CBL_11466 [Carabus blaptoides fortunei]
MGSFDLINLKNITRDVTQNITAISSISNSVEYNVLRTEDILIKRREDEGKIPVFARTDVVVNLYENVEEKSYETSTPYKNKSKSSPSSKTARAVLEISDDEQKINNRPCYSRSPGRHRSKTKSPLRDGVKRLESILDGIKNLERRGNRSSVAKEDAIKLFKDYMNESNELLKELTSKDARKRQRSDSERYSRSKGRKDYSKRHDSSRETSVLSRSPSPKRTKKESAHKYGHSSKYDSDVSIRSRRYRESSHSPSPSPRRSKKYYSSTKSRREFSVLDVSLSSSESNSSKDPFQEKKNKYMDNRGYDKYSGYSKRKRGHAEKPPGNHRNDRPGAMNAKDIEQRYYRMADI